MEPNIMQNPNPRPTPSQSSGSTPTPAPTHKHLAMWTVLFIVLIGISLLFWGWSARNPVGGTALDQYNAQLNTLTETSPVQEVESQEAAAIRALENDINSSLDLEVEDELKSIDLEF
jgi:hypothetical protein